MRLRNANAPCTSRLFALLGRRGSVSVIVFVMSLLLLGIGWTVKGGIDDAIRSDSEGFIEAGRDALKWIMGNGVSFESLMSHAVLPRYLIPSLAFGVFYEYCSEPVLAVVTLNWILFSMVGVALFQFWITIHSRSVLWTTKEGLFAAAAGGLYITFGLPDVFLWNYTVLTDIIFLFWVSVFVMLTIQAILSSGRLLWLVAFLVAIAAPFVRPPGVLLPILFFYGLIMWSVQKHRVLRTTVGTVGLALVMLGGFVIAPWLIAFEISEQGRLTRLLPEIVQSDFRQAVHFFKNGIVVAGRLETYTEAPTGYSDVLKAVMNRLLYYWVPIRMGDPQYSLNHNIVNAIYMLITGPLMLVGMRRLLTDEGKYQTVAMFLIMVALSYALLHSITLVSFDWRYQLPGMIPYWALSGIGFCTVFEWMRKRRIAGGYVRH